MINTKMPDAEFDLRKVEDEEIFGAVKDDVVNVIRSFKGRENIESKDVRLNTKYTNRREVLSGDSNMYPNIILNVEAKSYLNYDGFNLFINPFSIKIAEDKYDPKMIEDENLTKSFIKFMLLRFPNSDYSEKREEYFRKVELMQKMREQMLFHN